MINMTRLNDIASLESAASLDLLRMELNDTLVTQDTPLIHL